MDSRDPHDDLRRERHAGVMALTEHAPDDLARTGHAPTKQVLAGMRHRDLPVEIHHRVVQENADVLAGRRFGDPDLLPLIL